MTEKELIKKIQSLKQIEPRKGWVLLTKNRILEEKASVEARPQQTRLGLGLWSLFLRPAVVIPAVLLLIGGGIFYFSSLERLDRSQTKVAELEQDLARLEEMTPVLEQLQANLSQVRQNLDKARISNPKVVLEMRKEVEATAESVKKVVAEAKKAAGVEATTSEVFAEESEGGEVLTSIIAEIEKASGDLEKSYQGKVKDMVEYLIGEIEHWALGEIDRQRFEEAKDDYQNGDYNGALEKILSLGY